MTDFIIVGGGSAGCVLANRLSADPAVKVTLLEAGGWDKSPFIRMPAGHFQLMKTGQIDWGYHTEPQQHLNGRRLFWPRAKVLGGCSCINGMVYIRGAASDYDGWQQMGNRNWSFAECLPYFKKAENWNGPDDPFHGKGGFLHTSRFGVRHELSKAFIEAGKQMGYRETDDFNRGDNEGFGPCDSTIHQMGEVRRRASTAYSYLHPAKDRPNLTIITRALVTRVLIEGGRAVGVEYLQGGRRKELRCDREVLLSGGSINSPQLLQLSGVGDPDHLHGLGIKVQAELPGVGQNLHDHLAVGVQTRSTKKNTLLTYVRLHRAALALAQYLLTEKGDGAYHGIEALAFVKARREAIAPDIQYHFEMIMYRDHSRYVVPEHGYMPYLNISRPKSRGWLRIASTDPTRHPTIQPNYFSDPDDIALYREGIRIGREIIAQKAFDPFRGTEYAPGPNVRTDAEIDEYLRNAVETVYHPVGTCKMGQDSMAVVDDRLRVHGVAGLRVVDASIMPAIVSGNTNAPTIMIAERAADFALNPAQWERGDQGVAA
ncbi:choline dehydrogenase [Tabrizicola sp. TH137]|uniref:choline dehydrogenase n=1 Tax=Tabrizicola sp. TH137 TaxID=2067452 RepID=UPI000C7BD29C|nr:choline dehydrogenase [Tabrizicola sp. TH137]PLL13663.1 choline dehydrogenase [Tabrizicola sp. TH137]